MRLGFRGQESGVNDVVESQLSDDEGNERSCQTDKDTEEVPDEYGDNKTDDEDKEKSVSWNVERRKTHRS